MSPLPITSKISTALVAPRVLMVVPKYPYPVLGGLERQAHELAKALKNSDVNVQVSGQVRFEVLAEITGDQRIFLDDILGIVKRQADDAGEDGLHHQGLAQSFPIADQIVFRNHRHAS